MKKKSVKSKLNLHKELVSFAIVGLLLLPGAVSLPAAGAQTTGNIINQIDAGRVGDALGTGWGNTVLQAQQTSQSIQQARVLLNQLWGIVNHLSALLRERQAEGGASRSGLYANLKANGLDGPVIVASGSDVTLSWFSSSTTSCEGSSNKTGTSQWGETLPVTGSKVITDITESTRFKIKCDAANGEGSSRANIVDTVVVNVSGDKEEEDEDTEDGDTEISIELEAEPESLPEGGGDTELTWSTEGADTCTASSLPVHANWTGEVATSSGTRDIPALATTTVFSLSCENDTGSEDDEVTVTVAGSSGYVFSSNDGDSEPVTIQVTAPNGGENWVFGTQQRINWTTTGTDGTERVRIRLLDPNGDERKLITRDTANNGSFLWRVGTYEGGQAQAGQRYNVRVCLKNVGGADAVCDRGDARFTMVVASTAQANQESLMAAAGSIQSILDSLNSLLRLRY